MVPAYGFTSRCVQNAALPSSFGCCHRHELKRASEAACGLSDVAGADAPGEVDGAGDGLSFSDADAFTAEGLIEPAGAGASGVAMGAADTERRSSPGRPGVSLLKLYTNGFLQRA